MAAIPGLVKNGNVSGKADPEVIFLFHGRQDIHAQTTDRAEIRLGQRQPPGWISHRSTSEG